jgi:hypothetical protein
MREVDRTRLIQANRIKVCRRFICRLAMVLCLLSGVVGFTLLFERTLRISSARPKQALGRQAGLIKLIPPERISLLVASRRELVKSDRSEDDLWRLRERSGRKRSSARVEAGPKFYRALSLN